MKRKMAMAALLLISQVALSSCEEGVSDPFPAFSESSKPDATQKTDFKPLKPGAHVKPLKPTAPMPTIDDMLKSVEGVWEEGTSGSKQNESWRMTLLPNDRLRLTKLPSSLRLREETTEVHFTKKTDSLTWTSGGEQHTLEVLAARWGSMTWLRQMKIGSRVVMEKSIILIKSSALKRGS